jgi:uncharacterized membrane protein (UPF0182 family)
MRVPTQERRPFRVRGWMIAIVVILLVALFSLRGLAGFYTDYLWFDSLAQGATWSALLGAKVVPALVFTIVFFAILIVNLLIADRLAPKARGLAPQTPEDELVVRYQQATARYQGRIRVGVALFFAFIAGIGVSSQWREWILFTHRVDFGVADPQFHRDVGFYVFELPFIQFMIDWLFAGLVIVLLVTGVAHYLNGGIRFQSPLQRVTPQVKAHISVILAAMALVKTADYYFSRFQLDFSNRGVVDGASYTDVKAQLPALEFLLVVSIIAALLFVWNIWRRGWVLPVIAVGLWAFVSLIVGTIYPAAIQNFKVKPNEFANERKFIERNITATRAAFDLTRVKVQNFDVTDLQPAAVESNLTTIDNARLWDPEIIRATYQTLQGFQTYYGINDVDVDRYTVDGQVNPTDVAARELQSNDLPSQSWVNEHLVYTHGYGAVVSPNTKAAVGGNPAFFLSDIPTKANGIELTGKGAEVYFGEQLGAYVIVNGKQDEFNYPRPGSRGDAQTRYSGKDGVKLSNFIRRAAFALRFGDPNPLISGQVTGDSKVLMIRDIRDRVSKLAPFLELDADPYPVIVNRRLLWILDGYTTSDRYPYAQSTSGSGGLNTDVNYVRNSVKITVDGYDGTVKFYVIDSKDPIIRAYEDAFPDLFTPGSKMPAGVREHLRYPEDLFTVQSNVFSTYHVTEPRRFYQGSERWLLTPDPNVVVNTVSGTSRRSGRTNANRSPQITATTPRQDPYFLYVRLPGDDHESFLILEPFVPVSKDNRQTRLISFMTAKADPGQYGELDAFVVPQGRTITGPVQVANQIQSDPDISAQFTLLSRGGSSIVPGKIQLIPIGRSIVYIQPIFVQQSGQGGYPQFRFVAVFTKDRAVLAASVADGLNQLLGAAPTTPTTPTIPTTPTTPTTPAGQTAGDLLAQAAAKFEQADAALKNGDLATYQQREKEGRQLVTQALEKLRAGGAAATTLTSTPQAARVP